MTEKRAAFYQEVLRRVSTLAGVEQAAIGSAASLPMNNSPNQTVFVIENRATESERVPVAEAASVSSSYFDVLKTPLKRGRVFTELDNSKGEHVAVINEALARRYWPDADPVGQRIKLGRNLAFRASDLTIVGVVGDIRSDGFDTASAPYIYVSEPQAPPYVSVVYLRTSGDPGTLREGFATRCKRWTLASGLRHPNDGRGRRQKSGSAPVCSGTPGRIRGGRLCYCRHRYLRRHGLHL